MKLKYELVTMDMDGKTVAVPVGDRADELHGMIKLNSTAADILEALKEDTTIEGIVAKLSEIYEASEEELTEGVTAFVERLQREGMLE